MSDTVGTFIASMAWLAVITFIANIVFFFANLKLYTEIMKEKSQRERKP